MCYQREMVSVIDAESILYVFIPFVLTVELGPSKQCEKIYLETEVWTWGCGGSGQLGHADFLDRCVQNRYLNL